MMLRSVLIPVDFSEQSRDAVRRGAAFAARFNARLVVLSAVDPLLAEAAKIRLGQDLANTETEPALREFVAATWPAGAGAPADTTFETRVGEPAAVILEAADRGGVDLIVIGTHGLGGVRKWLLGSTTERVLRRTPVPVLAVPPAGPAFASETADGTLEIARVLAATDFSDASIAAVEYAAQLANQFAATLTLVHVIEPVMVPPQWLPLAEISDEPRVADARARLERLTARWRGHREWDAIVSVGRPADVIDSTARDRRAQLIVMGLGGDPGAFAPRPGSIAYRVLSATTVPVLVVPASSHRGADRPGEGTG